MIPFRLSPTNAPRPHHATPCPATFPREPSTRCEGVKGHDGPCVARITVTWWHAPKPPEKETPDA